MGAYDDLIPRAEPLRRRPTAYDDLLPASTDDSSEPVVPRVAEEARRVSDPLASAEAARATMSRRGGVRVAPPWGEAPPADTPPTAAGPSSIQRAAIAAEPYVVPALKTMKAVASGYPVAETAANLATGAVAMPVSGVTGLAAAVAKALGADVNPGDVVHKVGDALTYQPKTELGQHLTSATLYPLEKLQQAGKYLGEKAQDLGASPATATGVETAVNAVPLLLGGRGRAAKPRELPVEQRIEPTLAETPKVDRAPPQRIEPRQEVPAQVLPAEAKAPAPAAVVAPRSAYADLVPAERRPQDTVVGAAEAVAKPEAAVRATPEGPVDEQLAALSAERRGLEQQRVAEWGKETAPGPLEEALDAASNSTWDPARAERAASEARANGRQDVAEAIADRANREAAEAAKAASDAPKAERTALTRSADEAQFSAEKIAKAAGREAEPAGALAMPAATRGTGSPGSSGATVVPAAAAPAAPVPPQAGARSAGASEARPDAIRKAMQDLFDTVISEKHQGAKNLGIYRVKPETIRLRDRNDLRTAAHEVGHHISNRNQSFRSVMRQHDAELIAMMPQAYKAKIAGGTPMPRKLQIEEGFAEFVAEYLGDRPVAQAKAPSFFKAFETWLGNNPQYSRAIRHVADMLSAHKALSPEGRILAKVGAYTPPWSERAGALASKDTWDDFAQATLDKWHPLKLMVDDLAPGISTSKNPYVAARLTAGDAALIEDWLSNWTAPFDYAKRLDTKNYGKPLKAILEPVLEQGAETVNKFKAYLIARRAAELTQAGKEKLFEAHEIAGGLALETPQFKQAAAGVYAYQDRLLDYAVEGGLLSPDVAAKFRQYTSYIPFFREPEGAAAAAGGRGEPFKRLRGGTQNVRDPIANLIQNTANIVHATNRNAVLQKAVELAKAVPGGGRWIETVPVPMQAHNLATQRIVDHLKEQGVVVDTSMAQSLAAMQTLFTKSGRGDDRTRTIVYKAAGELKAAQVNDPLLWKAIGNIPPLEMGLIAKMLAFPAQTLRAGVVLDPTFMARNFIRDTLTATIQSKGAFIPVASTAQGMKMMAQHADAYKLWRSFGGAFADQFREPQEAAAAIERMAKRGGFSPASIISPGRLLDALKKVGSYSESGSRIGEFAATYKPGDFESALQAALNSREVSTDFGMRGGSDAMQTWTRIVPFMNPAMQGLYRAGRVLGGADSRALQVKAAVVGSAMALASIALALKNSGEEWYQQLEEWEKATYWHFKLGGEVWRVPKPFEYGALFASTPEAIALQVAGREGGEDFKKRMVQVLGQFAFRVVPQSATIVAEPWANKSFFTGRKIVPDRQQNLEPGLQATPSTSKSAQAVGEAINFPPAVIDNIVRNTFGTIGVHVTTAADVLLEKSGVFPPGSERSWRQWPAVKAFVHDPDNPNTKQMRDFYDDLEKYRTALATLREYRARGDEQKADDYRAAKDEQLRQARAADAVAKRIARIRNQIKSVEWDRSMTPREKREEVNAQNDEAQALVQEFRERLAPAGAR